jgi:hypothetical protein
LLELDEPLFDALLAVVAGVELVEVGVELVLALALVETEDDSAPLLVGAGAGAV